jgi:hypothetical protein
MKEVLKLLLVVLACGVAGCVNTVTENQPGSGPAYRDRLEARHQKSVDVVFEASKRALLSFGNITAEGKVFATTNQVRTLEGLVNNKLVYMRVEALAPQETSVVVQVRTKLGGTDLQIAKDLVQRIAVELN